MKAIISHKGFTLIEMLIAISIFIIFIGLSGQSYIGLVSANRRANEAQKTYREVRHVFDIIADEARNSLLDFSCISPNAGTEYARQHGVELSDADCSPNAENSELSTEVNVLAFVKKLPDGTLTRTLYRFGDTTDAEDAPKKLQRQEQTRSTDGLSWISSSSGQDSAWVNLTSSAVKLEQVTFDVFPRLNPYDRENAVNTGVQWQPSIGIKVKIPKQEVEYKTTYSSRSYGTRSLYSVNLPEA